MAERIDELNPIASISGTDIIIVDDGAETQRGTVAQVTAGLTYASEAQARAGTATGVLMDPLQTANAIDELASVTAGGANTFTGSNTFNGAVALYGAQSETLTATTNNLSLTATTNQLNVDLTGNQILNGLTGGANGRTVVVNNIDATESLTLAHDDAGSTAANRFSLPASQSFVVLPGQSVTLKYQSSRWGLIAQTYSTGTSDGDLVKLGASGALPSVDGSNITGVKDQLARDAIASVLAWDLIQGDAASIPGADLGQLKLVDNFKTDSLATKTNATYDPVNYWYTSESISATGTFGQSQTSTENIGGSFPYFGMKFTATSTGKVSQVKIQVTGVSVSDTAVFRLYTDSAGSPGTQIGSDSDSVNVNSTGEKTFTFSGDDTDITSSTDYWVVFVPSTPGSISIAISVCALQAGFGSGRAGSIGGISDGSNTSLEYRIEISEASGANVTLEPASTTIATGADDCTGWFIYEPVDSVTLGTDLLCSYSIDGGTTDETATLTEIGDLGNTGYKLFRADGDVSGQSGTSLLYTISSDNNKSLRYKGCAGVLPIYY